MSHDERLKDAILTALAKASIAGNRLVGIYHSLHYQGDNMSLDLIHYWSQQARQALDDFIPAQDAVEAALRKSQSDKDAG